MHGLKERRRYERYYDQTDIVYSMIQSNKCNNAKMLDYSMGGMYFNSKYSLDTGTEIYVKFLNFPSILHARVVRCNRIEDIEKVNYEGGVKYIDQV